MGYNYLTFEKRNDDIPTNKCWMSFTKKIREPKPDNGKKRCTREQLNEYNETVKHHTETMKVLEGGHVLLHNRTYNPDSLSDIVSDLFHHNNEDMSNRWFRIEPLQNITTKERFYSREEYKISEFNIICEVKNINDLIIQVIKDNDKDEFLYEVFDYGHFGNDGFKEFAISTFETCKSLSNEIPKLSDMLFKKYNHYEKFARYDTSDNNAHELALYLLDNGLVDLVGKYESVKDLFNVLIDMRWTDITLRVIEYINNHTELDYEKQWIINDKDVCKKLSLLNDDINVQKIMTTLDIKSDLITLVVKEEINDGYDKRIVETVNFEDMNMLRSYLVTKYKVPFDMASKDIKDIWMNEDSEFYGYHFRIGEDE